jgi:FdhE protein
VIIRRAPFLNEKEAAQERLPFYAGRFPESAEILYFYGRILECQVAIETPAVRVVEDFRGLNMAPAIRRVLETCGRYGTDILRKEAGELVLLNETQLGRLVDDFFRHALEGTSRLAVMAALGAAEPILEKLQADTDRIVPLSVCPLCGMPPVVSHLVNDGTSEGIRFARCGVCHTEWSVGRTVCFACGSDDDNKLAYFHLESGREVMMQLCRDHGRYTKIIDFRERSPVMPEMEDIATLSLDLWMQAHGHQKLFSNLFGY